MYVLVNDQLGHTRGDELIKQLADGLLALMATSGSRFRLGGDEFAIFAAADEEPRLRDGLAHLELQLREQGFELSGISYGVAHWSIDSDDPAEMIRPACSIGASLRSQSARRAPGQRTTSVLSITLI